MTQTNRWVKMVKSVRRNNLPARIVVDVSRSVGFVTTWMIVRTKLTRSLSSAANELDAACMGSSSTRRIQRLTDWIFSVNLHHKPWAFIRQGKLAELLIT